MCCIFTCCGWLIDLFQRVWVFAMTFCMSSAVCCVALVGSMAGVALGYNYSLSEYMELKETNTSVYLKRGIFDDETVADDIAFRRSGEEDSGLAPDRRSNVYDTEGSSTLRPGRNLDDSLLESNQNHGYEGGLMKLTVQPPLIITTTRVPIFSTEGDDLQLRRLMDSYPPNSMDQLKALQGFIDQRKNTAPREQGVFQTPPQPLTTRERYVPDFRMLKDGFLPGPLNPARKALGAAHGDPSLFPADIDPAFLAVPRKNIANKDYWETYKTTLHGDPPWLLEKTKPTAIKFNTEIQTPISYETQYSQFIEPTVSTPRTTPKKLADSDIESFENYKQKLILDKYGSARFKGDELQRESKGEGVLSDIEYYDEDIKGLPVRRKRQNKAMPWKMPRKPGIFEIFTMMKNKIIRP